MLKLNNIDWLRCHEFACSSLIKCTSELWNKSKMSTVEIGKFLKLNRGTVCRYLKQGSLLGFCNYDSKLSLSYGRKKGLNTASNNRKKKVIQLNKNGEFLKEWSSVKEAEMSVIRYNKGVVSAACRGKRKTASGFKWMYKEDYDRYIEEQNKRELQLT